ncbi:MAG: hypothetical protein V1660_03150 [archaeon]
MVTINYDVEGEIKSAYIRAPFDKGKEALERKGYRIISLEENARVRMQEGNYSSVSRKGNFTREGIIYVPKKGIFLTKNSPIMENAKEATDCHRQGSQFYLTDEQVESAMENSVELKRENIPTKRFKDNKITVYAFGDYAEQYGKFLENAGVRKMHVWLEYRKHNSFATQMWFSEIRNNPLQVAMRVGSPSRSDLECNCDLEGSVSVRGILNSAKGTVKDYEAYTPKQIAKALKDLGFSKLEKGLVKKLRQ